MQTSIVFGPKFQEEGGKKCLHLSRGLLRNETGVKWYSVGLTMTPIAGEVTQLTQLSNSMFLKILSVPVLLHPRLYLRDLTDATV